MKTEQWQFVNRQWHQRTAAPGLDRQQAQLVLVFGDPVLLTGEDWLTCLKDYYPNARIASATTAGEILGDEVFDHSIVATAIQLEKTTLKCSITNISRHRDSYETGTVLMRELLSDDLAAVFVLSDGTSINGSELVTGLNENNVNRVPVTGGLAADGDRFSKTCVGLDSIPGEGMVVAIGFYGKSLKIGHGSFGGWDEFGTERTITRAHKNILYEIDGKNALELYKAYLGPYKEELPGSALLFPLSLTETGSKEHLVRTILSINEQDKCMVFAGNMPQGSKVRLMKANFDRLIDGSSIAARNSFTAISNHDPQLALLISCVGRKLILQDRTGEEVEAAKTILGENTPIAGFYSYGEISPFNPRTKCELHNQTMTITTLFEA